MKVNMKYRFSLPLCIMLTLYSFGWIQAQSTKHVILISVDGLRPDFYLDKKWPAPVMQMMAEKGAHAQGVVGVFPSVTYPSHTTIISGVAPKNHGIYFNSPFEEGGQTGKWYWEYEGIKVPTLFSAVRAAGKKSGAVSWPVTVGAPIDYNLPEVWSLDRNIDRYLPMREWASPKGFAEELEEKAIGPIEDASFGSKSYFVREQKFAGAASYIFEKYKPNLLAVHLIATDHFQHTDGREGFMPARALAAVDVAISQILETVERAGLLEETTFIITGDHGFVDIHSIFSPNILLVQAGLMQDQTDRGNWKASFHTSGAAAFLMLKDPKDKKTLDQVRAILNKLPQAHRKLFRIVEREELDLVGADPHTVLALAPVEGVNMSSATKGDLVKPGKGGTHGFYPDFENIQTGFIAFGAGIRKGAVLKKMYLQDIAPLIAKLLLLEFQTPEGTFYPGIIE